MRSFDGKPAPTRYEQEAAMRFLLGMLKAIDSVHGPRSPKPKNIEPAWLPPTDWTPEDDEAEGDGEDPA